MSRSRRVGWLGARRCCALAVAAAVACLAASLASLALTGPASAAVTGAASAAAAAARTTSCFPLSESTRNCYNAGEFCPDADLNKSGVAANGGQIACESQPGEQQPRWEACTLVTFPPTPGSTATQTATPVTQPCPPTPAGAAPGASTATPGAPVSAPATGGGTGPGPSGTLAAAGAAVMAAGAGLILLSRRRGRRKPV